MKRIVVVVAVTMLLVGCVSPPRSLCDAGQKTTTVWIGNGPAMGAYIGPPGYEKVLRSEISRQLLIVGQPKEYADIFDLEVELLDPVGENQDGKYGNLPGSGNVHAAWTGRFDEFDVKFWFAACPEDKPYMPHVSHEVLHNTLIIFYDIGAHPTEFELGGVPFTSKHILLSDARWPQRIMRGAWRVLTPWTKRIMGTNFVESVNGEVLTGGFSE